MPQRALSPLPLAFLLACGAAAANCSVLAQQTGPSQAAPAAARPQRAPADAPAAIRFDVVAGDVDHRIDRLLEQMTLAEKVGQLVQVYPDEEQLTKELAARIRVGEIGSIFYPGAPRVVEEAQRIAMDESRLGIPLVVARDVVHGFRTLYPIPLGQAASWNPGLVRRAAAASAQEARSHGVRWSFAPMVDVCRDPRWGRVAETLGEDPLLASALAAAIVEGLQLERDGRIEGLAACVKHFVAYGAAEGGRDYNRASLSAADLHNVHLPPFRAAVDAGCRSLMTTFSEVNGVPGTAHAPLLEGVLRRRWGFEGVVVSDWASITEMTVHGYAQDDAEAARLAIAAGVDMDMCSPAFAAHLCDLVEQGLVPEARVDEAVRRVLRLKVALGLKSESYDDSQLLKPRDLELARKLARQSVVLLKNKGVLPLSRSGLQKVAVIGPLADAPEQQLGCWSLDGREEDSVTPLDDLRARLAGAAEVIYARGAASTYSQDASSVKEAAEAARGADVALVFIGEDALLSGEARSRAHIELPGVQRALVEAVEATGTPTVLVVMSGRPLAIGHEVELADAALFAWHPGTMAGPAIGDLLMGVESPSGKLPVTFPKTAGQAPLYYNHTNTGRPSPPDYEPLLATDAVDLPERHQYRSHYLDVDPQPLFPFGYGLSYSRFEYSEFQLAPSTVRTEGAVRVSVRLANTGDVAAAEVTQLYVRDRVSRPVRPVRELKAFRRTQLEPGESVVLEFELPATELGCFDNAGRYVVQPGAFDVWVGGDSRAALGGEFTLLPPGPGETAAAGADARRESRRVPTPTPIQ